MRKQTKFLLLRLSIILAFAILAGRTWYVQVVMGSYYTKQGDTSKIRLEPVQALRGIIYDRNHRQLVFNAPSWRVAIVPHAVPRSQAAAIYRSLARLLHNSPTAGEIATRVHAGIWQPYQPVTINTRPVSAATAMVIRQLHSELPGVRVEAASIRRYSPGEGLSMSHIMGYVSGITPTEYADFRRLYPQQHVGPNDTAGQDGVEASLNPYLHGINGTQQVEVDAGERPIRVLRTAHTVPGDSVYLTIDWTLQQQVARDLGDALSHLGLRRGVAIVENVRTGEILAMVSLPSFDNNWFAHGISQKHFNALNTDASHPLSNTAIQGLFPPGSTYKVITASAALESGVADVNRTIQDNGVIDLYGRKFFGWDPKGLGPMNVVSALARSSDIYFYTVAGGNPNVDPHMPRIGAARLAHYAGLYGLGATTGIELPGEQAGHIPTPAWFNHISNPLLRSPGETWHIGHTYNVAIGQGQNLVTPLQMVNVAATIANGGKLLQPRVVERIVGSVIPRRGAIPRSRVIEPFVPTIIRQNFISPFNLALIQQGMHLGVTSAGHDSYYGTSYNVRDPRIDAAGKTGTAEAPGGAHAWWIGYAPYTSPQVAVVVLVPNARQEGAYASAPVAHKILEDYFHLKPSKPNWLSDVGGGLVSTLGSQ